MKRLCIIVLGAGFLLYVLASKGSCEDRAHNDADRKEEIRKTLRSRELDLIRQYDRVETFALEDTRGMPLSQFPSGKVIPTDLPGKFIALPEKLPVVPEIAKEISELILKPSSYVPWISACMFSPAVAVRYHRGAEAMDIFICFQCRELAFQVVGASHAFDKLMFTPAAEPLLQLIKQARPADVRLEEVRKQWDQEAENARKSVQDEKRWRTAMPRSIRPFWDSMNSMYSNEIDIQPMKKALEKEFPESNVKIIKLFEWFGSGAGPWSGYPSYESVAERLLLMYPTAERLAAIKGKELTSIQTEGVARLFGGWDFKRQRPKDISLLSPETKERLLAHSLQSSDEDKRARATSAFKSQ